MAQGLDPDSNCTREQDRDLGSKSKREHGLDPGNMENQH